MLIIPNSNDLFSFRFGYDATDVIPKLFYSATHHPALYCRADKKTRKIASAFTFESYTDAHLRASRHYSHVGFTRRDGGWRAYVVRRRFVSCCLAKPFAADLGPRSLSSTPWPTFIHENILNSDSKIGLVFRSLAVGTSPRPFGNRVDLPYRSLRYRESLSFSYFSFFCFFFFFFFVQIGYRLAFASRAQQPQQSHVRLTLDRCISLVRSSSFPPFFLLLSMRRTCRPFVFETAEFGRTTRNRSRITRRYCHKRTVETYSVV